MTGSKPYSLVRSFTFVDRRSRFQMLLEDRGIQWGGQKTYTWNRSAFPEQNPDLQPENVYPLDQFERVEGEGFVAYFDDQRYVFHADQGIVVSNIEPSSLVDKLKVRDKGNVSISNALAQWA